MDTSTIEVVERVVLPQDLVRCSTQKVDGDRFIICEFDIKLGTIVRDTDSDLSALMSRLPDYLCDDTHRTTHVAEVFDWRQDKMDPTDYIPYALTTLYEIRHHNDPFDA